MIVRDGNHYFRIESAELVQRLETGLLAPNHDLATLDELFRGAHTLKGAARSVGMDLVGDLAHTMEDVLADHRESGEPLSPIEVGELLSLVDAIRAQLAPVHAVAVDEERFVVDRGGEGVRISSEDMDALTGGIAEVESRSAEVRAAAITSGELRALALRLASLASHVGPSGAASPRLRAGLDELVASLGDQTRVLRDASERLEAELRQVSQRAFEFRLVALGELVPELERTVHDAARATAKHAQLEVHGMEVRVDVRVLAQIRGVLVHLVRNAIAHGIEERDGRRAAGKPDVGRVSIRVERRGGRIGITVKDDGSGLDREAILDSARVRGLVDADSNDYRMADELVFHPGLSTARAVSDLAGRGVGLDAVRSIVDACNGSIGLRSVEGMGTSFELELPISLAATRALVVESSGETFLVPIDFVIATRRVGPDDVVFDGGRASILHDERVMPFRELAEVAGIEGAHEAPRIAIVIRTRVGEVALGVGALRGTRDVVLRPLPHAMGRSRRFAGASVDRGGVPRLVLDPDGLVGDCSSPLVRRPKARLGKPVLVIDDSLTTRMLEQSILESVGYEVDVASSAEEGLAMAEARDYGIYVCDVEMPGMNGYDFTRETRRRPSLASVPVIMVTSLDSAESRKRGADAGVATYIVKGEFDQGTFLRAVSELGT